MTTTLRDYLHRPLLAARMHDAEMANRFRVRGRWVPDELEAFDEVEVAFALDAEREITLSLAVEEGRIERMILGWAPAGDDDEDPRALPPDDLEEALAALGDRLTGFLDCITG